MTKTHGQYKSGAYNSWQGMFRRTKASPISKAYRPAYADVEVCERWHTFTNFLADMGQRPEGLQLDRIDNAGHYEPGNCRWVTSATNQRNRRNNRKVRFKGKLMTLSEAAREAGLAWSTVTSRLKRGWSTAKTLNTPVGEYVGSRYGSVHRGTKR